MPSEQPGTNCIVICCDTFRADMIGHPVVKTPNLDRLVREGITFTQAFAEGLPTIQARRTCFSGVRSFPWRFEMDTRGVWPAIPGWHRIPSGQTTLAEHLYENRVVTGLVGDTYHMFKPTHNFTRGFCSWDFIRGQEGDTVRSGPLSAIDVTPYVPDGASTDPREYGSLAQYLLNILDRRTEEDYLPARVFRRACSWVEENRENDPWFLWIDSFAPHERWDPPMAFADRYYVAETDKNYIQPQVVNYPGATEDEIERTKALYYGYVTFVDKWIGVLLDKLEQCGLMDSTAVIFTSDHGTELWDRNRVGKGGDRLHAYNTRLPFLVRLPGGRDGGRTRDDFVQHQDVFPTVCGVLGVTTGADLDLDGRDIFDVDGAAPEKVITGWGPTVSVRDRQWNLVLDSTGGERCELYDLEADPNELANVAEQHADVVSDLKAFLEDTLGELPYEIKHRGDGRQVPPHVMRIRPALRAEP